MGPSAVRRSKAVRLSAQGEFRAKRAKFSPDGQWMAYDSTETGREEVYVVTFPSPTGKWQVSTNGGRLPVWSRDGKELFFVSGDSRSRGGELMAVEIRGRAPNSRQASPRRFLPHIYPNSIPGTT